MSWWDDLTSKASMLGGLGSSTNPSDYKTPYADSSQIHGVISGGLNQVQNRAAPTIAPDFRNAQLAQMGQLQGIASGQQQGAGELAVQRQAQQAMASQQAMAHMARGGNAGMAMLGAQRQGAGIGANAAGQGQMAAMQDQQGAQGLLAGLANSGRAGDLGVAGMQQQQTGQNDQATMGYLQQLTGMDQGQIAAQIAAMQANNAKSGWIGGLMQTGAQVAAGLATHHSDERLKTNIRDGRAEVDEALSHLVAKSYSYKDQKHGEGQRVGIMAQDLERSRIGRDIVYDAPDGKALDVNRALSLSLAANARLHERVSELERRK